MEAVSLRAKLPLVTSRIIMSYLYLVMKDFNASFTLKQKEFASAIIRNVRSELLFEYADLLDITLQIDPAFVDSLIVPHLSSERWSDAAILISYFKLHEKYPCTKIVEKLAWDKKMGIAKDLCEGIPELQLHLVNYLSSIDNSKGAA